MNGFYPLTPCTSVFTLTVCPSENNQKISSSREKNVRVIDVVTDSIYDAFLVGHMVWECRECLYIHPNIIAVDPLGVFTLCSWFVAQVSECIDSVISES